MKKLLAVSIFGFAAAFNSFSAPTSAEQLRSEFEAALKAGDTNAFLSLFNWDGVSNSMNLYLSTTIHSWSEFRSRYPTNQLHAFAWLHPLPDDYETEGVINGIRYGPNVSVVGMMQGSLSVDDNGTNTGWDAEFPYGEKSGGFYFAGTTTEKIYEPKTKDKILIVEVNSGDISDNSPAFAGTYAYVQNGLEIKKGIKGKGTAHKISFGDYVKSCFVQKTSGGTNLLELEISEDGKKIFDSQMVETNDSISYEKKN